MLRSFTDVLALWTPKQLSRVLPVPYSTAVAMYQRGRIGPGHWARLIEAAADRGETLTADMLLRFRDQAKAAKVKAEQPGNKPRPRGRPPKSRTQSLPAPS